MVDAPRRQDPAGGRGDTLGIAGRIALCGLTWAALTLQGSEEPKVPHEPQVPPAELWNGPLVEIVWRDAQRGPLIGYLRNLGPAEVVVDPLGGVPGLQLAPQDVARVRFLPPPVAEPKSSGREQGPLPSPGGGADRRGPLESHREPLHAAEESSPPSGPGDEHPPRPVGPPPVAGEEVRPRRPFFRRGERLERWRGLLLSDEERKRLEQLESRPVEELSQAERTELQQMRSTVLQRNGMPTLEMVNKSRTELDAAEREGRLEGYLEGCRKRLRQAAGKDEAGQEATALALGYLRKGLPPNGVWERIEADLPEWLGTGKKDPLQKWVHLLAKLHSFPVQGPFRDGEDRRPFKPRRPEEGK